MFDPDIKHYEVITSTNDEAKELLTQGKAPQGTVIWADKQTRGRGRMGRRWHSEQGNLYFSIVLKPGRSLVDIAQLSFLASIAVGESISPLIGSNGKVTYKWPNDILVNGQKICGILLETESTPSDQDHPSVIIGVGVNIAHSPEFVLYPATRLKEFMQTPPTPQELLNSILSTMTLYYDKWYHYGFDPIREMWLEKAHGLEELITVIVHNEPLVARFDGIDNNGFLLCTDENNRLYKLSSAEVLFT